MVSIPALVRILAARLQVALGPEFRVAADEPGHSIEVAYQDSTRRVALPFGRFRLLSAAEAVCLTCRFVLAAVQQFASTCLGHNWPESAQDGLLESRRPRPTVTEHDGVVMLEWQSEAGKVLSLGSIALSDVVDRSTSAVTKL